VAACAATKRAGELLSETYVHLHKLRATGLRYFTVYGPWGRPDMAPYIFAKAIHEGSTIKLFHLALPAATSATSTTSWPAPWPCLDKPAVQPGHRLYNLGAAGSDDVAHIIELFEKALAKKAVVELHPGEPGDMLETSADITETTRDFAWTPKVTVEEGIPKFVEWFKSYNRL